MTEEMKVKFSCLGKQQKQKALTRNQTWNLTITRQVPWQSATTSLQHSLSAADFTTTVAIIEHIYEFNLLSDESATMISYTALQTQVFFVQVNINTKCAP